MSNRSQIILGFICWSISPSTESAGLALISRSQGFKFSSTRISSPRSSKHVFWLTLAFFAYFGMWLRMPTRVSVMMVLIRTQRPLSSTPCS